MAKYLIQIIVLGTQAVGRAFAKALRQEYQASQAAAQARRGTGGGGGGRGGDAENMMRLGMSLDEARQILNVNPEAKPEDIQKQYEHLFNINDKCKGGSFYIQSKVYRAKERIYEDAKKSQQSSHDDDATSADSKPPPDADKEKGQKSES